MLRRCVWFMVLAAVAGSAAWSAEIAPGVDLIPGRFVAGVQPDGNTVVFRGTDGLVVVDTGRHTDHTQAVIDFAAAAHLPVAAIVNSHWHLDHIGGNGMMRKAFPKVRIYASGAFAAARQGFLKDYRAQLEQAIASTPEPEKQKAWKTEMALIDDGDHLAPDEVVAKSGERRLAGRTLDLELEDHAVTAGDLWVFDPKTRVLAAGDLVTVPVPFLDTACPRRWQAALGRLAAKDFSTLVPGHGAPMQHKDFDVYRTAFDHLLTCAASKVPKGECVDGWMKDAASLVGSDDPKFVRSSVDYYVEGVLRGDAAQTAKLCGE